MRFKSIKLIKLARFKKSYLMYAMRSEKRGADVKKFIINLFYFTTKIQLPFVLSEQNFIILDEKILRKCLRTKLLNTQV